MPVPAQDPHRPSFISPLLAAVIFGFASGAVGAIVAIAVAPAPSVIDATATMLRPFQTRRPVESVAVPATVQAATNAVVDFFAQKKPSTETLVRSYNPWEAIGSGVVLTSDGWLLAHASLWATGKITPRVAVVAGRSYPVTVVVRDPYSGVAFVKIEAVNLSVRAFGEDDSFQIGDPLYSFDADRGIRRTDIIAFAPSAPKNENDLVHSSERLHRVIRLSGTGALAGAALMNSEGQVVALAAGDGATAIPYSSFSAVVGSVLKDGKIVRPRLSVNYVDLSKINRPFDVQVVKADSGALLAASPDAKRPAVLKGSPAAAIGLRAGDIITAVDGETISARKPLADILATNTVGATVKLSVRRGNAELTLDAVLGAEEGK